MTKKPDADLAQFLDDAVTAGPAPAKAEAEMTADDWDRLLDACVPTAGGRSNSPDAGGGTFETYLGVFEVAHLAAEVRHPTLGRLLALGYAEASRPRTIRNCRVIFPDDDEESQFNFYDVACLGEFKHVDADGKRVVRILAWTPGMKIRRWKSVEGPDGRRADDPAGKVVMVVDERGLIVMPRAVPEPVLDLSPATPSS